MVSVRLGAVLVSVPENGEAQATFADALLGVTIILLAGLLPGVIYRLSGGLMNTSAGQAPRAGGGLSAQSAQSIQSSADMTRMIMERNNPQPALAASPFRPNRMGSAAATGGGLGGAAIPVGLAAVATAVTAGALESGGRWVGGQAATAGGVFGDVDAPHVPAPPISRLGQYGSRRPGATQPESRTGHTEGRQQPAQVTVVQTSSTPPDRAPLTGSGPQLIIPGTVVPDRTQAELPAAPTLPSREDRDEPKGGPDE